MGLVSDWSALLLPAREEDEWLEAWTLAQLQLGVRSLLNAVPKVVWFLLHHWISSDITSFAFFFWLPIGKVLDVVISLIHSRTRAQ